jgi:hypothetical protein
MKTKRRSTAKRCKEECSSDLHQMEDCGELDAMQGEARFEAFQNVIDPKVLTTTDTQPQPNDGSMYL